MTIIQISPALDRLLPTDRVLALSNLCSARRALLNEATAVVRHPKLSVWQPEARQLVESLRVQCEKDDDRTAKAKAAISALETAARAESEATIAFTAACGAHEVGSIDRATALALRDDAETLGQKVRILARVTKAACNAVVALLPPHGDLSEPAEPRALVAALGSYVTRVAYESDLAGHVIAPEQWQRYLGMSAAELAWVPLAAARFISQAAADQRSNTQSRVPDWRRIDEILPVDDFTTALAAYRAERESTLRSKASQARQAAQAAQDALASLGGAA